MSAIYDNWDRLVTATLRREELREIALRIPSDLSLASSSSFSSSFNLGSFHARVSSFSSRNLSLVAESFTYPQILEATDHFRETKLIKHGSTGDIYAGVLESGLEVVIKEVNFSNMETELSLISEMEIHGIVNYSRVLPLLGHCLHNASEMFLVYKYMPNKDLSKFLSGESTTSLDWTMRLKIATQVAEGLDHLHHACSPPLVHRDIRASSILLDENFEVRLGSLHRACVKETDIKPSGISRLIPFSVGFAQRNSGGPNATCAYDAYCFGMVLLELITGKLGVNDVRASIMKNLRTETPTSMVSDDKKLISNIIDQSLFMDEHILEEIRAVAYIAKACLDPKHSKRPKMAEIVNTLKGLLARSVQLYPNGKIYSHAISRIFSFGELEDATGNFGVKNYLGQDEFGKLYRGIFHEKSKSRKGTGSPIVIKKMDRTGMDGFQKLQATVELLGRLSHPNIMQPLGYCFNDDQLLLVYEFTQEGNLKKYFHKGSLNLTWDKRLKILIGAARGLAFLHTSQRQGYFQQKENGEGFYGFFTCSKILLDLDYNPKITGFGVAEVGPPTDPNDLFDVHPRKFLYGRYTHGAPEYRILGEMFRDVESTTVNSYLESDVYGFGVVLVHMITGVEDYHPSDEIMRLKPHIFIETYMDRFLEGEIPAEAAVKMAQLALLCLQNDRKLRPSMEQVVEILEGIQKIQNNKDDLNELDSLLKRASKSTKTVYVSASRLKHQNTGFGGIILNENRSLIDAWSIYRDQNLSLVESTLHAIRYAQVKAEEKNWKRVQIRCDVQGIINKIIDENKFDVGLSNQIAEDIIHSRMFKQCSFVYVPKEWNESCNILADMAVESQTSQEWSSSFPSWLIEANQKRKI